MHVTNSVSITYSRRNYILFLSMDKFLNVLHQKKMSQLPYALSHHDFFNDSNAVSMTLYKQ
jgi:hypothetical protein